MIQYSDIPSEMRGRDGVRDAVKGSFGLVLAAALASSFAISCGGSSDSEVAGGGDGPGAGGSSTGPSNGGTQTQGGSGSGSHTSAGSGNGNSSGSGSMPQAGSASGGGSNDGGSGNSGGACEARTEWTEASHYVLQVTWPATTAAQMGTGHVDIYSRVKFKATGNDLTGELYACGLSLPEASLTVAAQLATGGQKIFIDVPTMVWDASGTMSTMVTGKQSASDIGSTIETASLSLQGVKMSDPMAAWPASGASMETFDFDMDGMPGYTSTPRSGGGYVLPPTALGIAGSAPSADKLYLVSRVGMKISGKRTSCDAHSGTATVTAFNNHVVGCHVKGAAECDKNQADFVDQNRMVYEASSATYEAKVVPDSATCNDVRAAFTTK